MKRYSLFVQLVMYVAITTLFLLGLVGSAYYYTSSNIIRETTEHNTQNTISQSGQFVHAYLSKLKKITTSLATNDVVKAYSEQSTSENEEKLQNLLETILSTDQDLVAAVLVTKSGDVVTTDEAIKMKTSHDMMQEAWYQAAIHERAMPVLTPARQTLAQSNDKWVVSVTQEIVDQEGNNLAVIRLDIAYDTLSRYLDSLQLGENGFTFIVNQKHEFVYHPNKAVYSSSNEMKALEPYILSGNGRVNNEEAYIFHYEIPQSDWLIIGVASMENLFYLKRQMLLSLIGIGLLALSICLVGIWFILRHWIKPLRDLQGTILAIERGNTSLRAKEWGSPELVDLSHHFNRMLDQNERLMQVVKEEEQTVRQYELQALSSQINPHFLYNTLDTIIWMAEFNNSEKVVEVTKSLAKYFRLALNRGNEQIRLKDEIDHVRQYLFIQKQRYGDKLSYDIIEDARFDDFYLPKLVLQPLVENAIYHGIKEIERQGIVRVSVEQVDNFLLISIYDNGPGFIQDDSTESFLIKLGGVGLKNVDQRLSLQFGDQYHMKIDSLEGKYTKILLFFPLPVVTDIDVKE